MYEMIWVSTTRTRRAVVLLLLNEMFYGENRIGIDLRVYQYTAHACDTVCLCTCIGVVKLPTFCAVPSIQIRSNITSIFWQFSTVQPVVHWKIVFHDWNTRNHGDQFDVVGLNSYCVNFKFFFSNDASYESAISPALGLAHENEMENTKATYHPRWESCCSSERNRFACYWSIWGICCRTKDTRSTVSICQAHRSFPLIFSLNRFEFDSFSVLNLLIPFHPNGMTGTKSIHGGILVSVMYLAMEMFWFMVKNKHKS